MKIRKILFKLLKVFQLDAQFKSIAVRMEREKEREKWYQLSAGHSYYKYS